MTCNPCTNGQGGPTTYTYGYDVHGSVSQLVDPNGKTAASYGYTPYGQSDSQLSQGDTDKTTPLNLFRYSSKRLDTGSGTLDMGVRRFGPDTSHFLTPDFFYGSLSNLGLSVDPITGNRYDLAGGNPISFAEWDGHVAEDDAGSGGGPSTTPNSGKAQTTQGQSNTQSSGSQSVIGAAKDALTKCFKKGDPSDLGFAAAVLSPFCNPEKRTVPNPGALCSLTASNAGLGAGVRLECAAPPDLQHDPVLRGLSAIGGNPEDTLDAVLGRDAAKAQERQAAKPVKPYEVGTYGDLKARSVAGDNLQIHHVPQKHPAGQVIEDYDPYNAPAIALPDTEHFDIPRQTGPYSGSAQDLIRTDIANLRNYTQAPEESIQQLLGLIKQRYGIG